MTVPTPVALITGAAQGLGRAVALRLASEGFTVALNDLTASPGLLALAEETGGVTYAGDVADRQGIEAIVARIEEEVGPLHVVVANAAHMRMSAFLHHEPIDWWRHIEVNLCGAFYVCRAAADAMITRHAGSIVILSSRWGITGQPNASAYAASKAGMIPLVRSLAAELGPAGIRVNVLAPGPIDTPQLNVDAAAAGVLLDELKHRIAATLPLRRVPSTQEIAESVAFLASSRSECLNGAVLQPNGGSSVSPF